MTNDEEKLLKDGRWKLEPLLTGWVKLNNELVNIIRFDNHFGGKYYTALVVPKSAGNPIFALEYFKSLEEAMVFLEITQ